METNENLLSNELLVDSISHAHFQETSKGAKFLGIVGIMFSVLIAMVGIFAGTFFKSMMRSGNPYGAGGADIASAGLGFITLFL